MVAPQPDPATEAGDVFERDLTPGVVTGLAMVGHWEAVGRGCRVGQVGASHDFRKTPEKISCPDLAAAGGVRRIKENDARGD